MSKPKLLLCPFCGKEPSHSERLTDTLYAVVCYCDAQGPVVEHPMEGENFDGRGCRKAVTAWNTRPSGWIDVKDRLPEKEDYYEVTYFNQYDIEWTTTWSGFSFFYIPPKVKQIEGKMIENPDQRPKWIALNIWAQSPPYYEWEEYYEVIAWREHALPFNHPSTRENLND